jgi:predicted Zn-dependent protease
MKSSSLKPLLVATLFLCLLTASRPAGRANPPTDAADAVITEYRSDDPAVSVRVWQTQMTRTSGNPRFAEFQKERLEEWQKTEFAPHRLDDPRVTALVFEIIRPALVLYRRQDCFKLLVVEHPVPVAMNDSGVLLMVTTGLIERATSDDEILGVVAHELDHDIHWRRTAKARQTLELREHGAGTELMARQAREELVKIELECDAFSAITLAAMGRNPGVFGRFLLASAHDYSDLVAENMPPADERARVIERVVPVTALSTSPRQSEAFKKLKALLETRKHL